MLYRRNGFMAGLLFKSALKFTESLHLRSFIPLRSLGVVKMFEVHGDTYIKRYLHYKFLSLNEMIITHGRNL